MKCVAAALALAAAGPLAAQDAVPVPVPAPVDPRIRTVAYDAGAVLPLQVTPGYQLIVEFATDEVIENVALGEGGGWQVTPNQRGDRLVIRPAGGGTTNLTVITDRRTYAFDLSTSGGAPIYILRFTYGAPVATTDAAIPAGRYRLGGAAAIRPDAISDDGQKTDILWRADQRLPAIYVIDRDGHETLASGAMRDGRYVIDGVANRILFRLDRATATATRVPALKR